MSDLKPSLESIADAGVAGIALLPPHESRAPGRSRGRSIVGATAGICIVVAAVAVAVSVRSSGPRPATRPPGPSKLVADASYEVPSAGMSPTLQIGDVVSGTTHFDDIERGDVLRIRFRQPPPGIQLPMGGEAGFKRVVGLPGDVVEGRGGLVFVNGHKLSEPYVTDPTGDFPRAVVAPDAYFLLGDNRANSADSRVWGSVNRSEVIGIALEITAPAARAGPIAGSPR
jgi:signal peptidase I